MVVKAAQAKRALLLALTAFIAGCSGGPSLPMPSLPFFGGSEAQDPEFVHRGPTLGESLGQLPELDIPEVEAIKPSRADVMAAYNRVYGKLPSLRTNQAVGKRLADLHMEVGENLDIAGEAQPYDQAISLYESLLSKGNLQQADEVLYQLARAHDLAGNGDRALDYLDRLIGEYPLSEYIGEGRFRRAEIRFSAENFRAAAEDYAYVVELGGQSPYYRNASYMLGWTQFKRSRFAEGLENFFNVVDYLLLEGETQSLDAINTELLEDTFRVVTLALAYLDGPLTLAEEMRQRARPHWQYLAYERLAADYFDKSRFLDSVQTWQTFVEHNSLDARAPGAHIGMIQTLIDAGFPSDVLPKKEEFILRYGVYSEFWQHHPSQVRETYLPTLHDYLTEIATLAHAKAQNPEGHLLKASARGSKRDKRKISDEQRRELFLSAAGWYDQIVITFPDDPRTAEYLLLLGESYAEAAEHGRAVAALQRVVREYPTYDLAHEAGYAAILGLHELVSSAAADELELWQRLKIDAQIEFALMFPGDSRAPAVQADAANALFGLGHASEALDLADNLLAEWPDVTDDLRRTALLIIGHVRFAELEYAVTEQAYRQVAELGLREDQALKVRERLLASIYKQGEAAEAEGLVDAAVAHYLRIAEVDMAAELAIQGHFDAVAMLEGAQRAVEAAKLLSSFRKTYPDHQLAAGIDLRLASMYEQTENWSAAALEYVGLSKHAAEQEVRRQSLYRAAEIYLQQEDLLNAIENFRDYAHTYKQPLDLRLEAMHHMDELYQRTDEPDKRRFWLKKKIALHQEMGDQVTGRSRWLAANAQAVFAEDEKSAFAAIRLGHPLKRSLKKKQKALRRTLKAYETLAAYEVAEFTTASTYEIADLYSVLSKSIMKSDRPRDLSELELAQYEILLEEQAFPFEEQAIDLHAINMRRAWDGLYDEWVRRSYTELARLMPGRFDKREAEVSYAQSIH